MSSIYDFSATTLSGETQNFADYQGKILLIVNTASECGFTPQFAGLEALYKKYQQQGVVVIGFPCNQFGQQEPGDATQIEAFCQKNYGVSFPMMAKIDVNGDNAHPIYQWLKHEKHGFLTEAIKWNFTKFLVGRDGQVVARYASTTKPEDIETQIEKLL